MMTLGIEIEAQKADRKSGGYPARSFYWDVAQLVEREAVNFVAPGSNPGVPANRR